MQPLHLASEVRQWCPTSSHFKAIFCSLVLTQLSIFNCSVELLWVLSHYFLSWGFFKDLGMQVSCNEANNGIRPSLLLNMCLDVIHDIPTVCGPQSLVFFLIQFYRLSVHFCSSVVFRWRIGFWAWLYNIHLLRRKCLVWRKFSSDSFCAEAVWGCVHPHGASLYADCGKQGSRVRGFFLFWWWSDLSLSLIFVI